ncbi:MAG: serine/threonine-protein phosphatase [Anaerolineae bacterium]|nr:serine/threonine-protein phosphatase [Anaerolineae bacterium]
MFDFIKKIFGQKKSAEPIRIGVETAPLSEEQLQIVTKRPMTLRPPQMAVGTAQSDGRQRDHNEDTIFALTAVLADGVRDLPLGVYVVADGMGGHQNGEVASSAAARTMVDYVMSKLYSPLLGSSDEGLSESIQEIMEGGVREAHRAVQRHAPGGGTTLTAALVLGQQVTFAHVGDSRGYFVYPDGRIVVATHDHSYVQRLLELGQITEKEVLTHPQRNVLYRALGQAEPFRPDINTFEFPHPGYLMICSDGLWGTITETEIFRIINSNKNLTLACHQLVDAANAAGGPDNISVILVEYLS